MKKTRRPFPTRRGLRDSALVATLAVAALGLVACADDPASPEPPSGGQEYRLDYDTFAAAVAPVFSARGCNAEGDCHGGGIRGTFALTPDGNRDLSFEFEQAALQVDGAQPALSRLLQKPLAEAAGGAPHGAETFANTDDTDYQAILAWIEAGEFQ